MMNDPLTWSPINLGRWGGAQVRVHISLIVFVVITLLGGLGKERARWRSGVRRRSLLAGGLPRTRRDTPSWRGGSGHDPDDVRLWPAWKSGHPAPACRSNDNLLVALAGPIVNAALVLVSVVVLATLERNSSGAHSGIRSTPARQSSSSRRRRSLPLSPAPRRNGGKPSPRQPFTSWFLGTFGYYNYVLLLVNLIPALPFDNGRVFRAYLANASVTTAKDGLLPPLLARSWRSFCYWPGWSACSSRGAVTASG